MEQDARTNTIPIQDKNWHGRKLTWGTHIPPPYLEFALLGNKTQVCGVQVFFHGRSYTKMYQGVVIGAAPMFIGVSCPSFSLIST